MPLSKSGKKAMKKFKKQYGEKGESVYYATAKKQGRNEKTFKKEESILTNLEKTLLEEVNNLFHNNKKTLGITQNGKPKEEIHHNMQFQYEYINDLFSLKITDSPYYESLRSAFYNIHGYKMIDDPRFGESFKKQCTAIGVPTEFIHRAFIAITETIDDLKKDIGLKEDEPFSEKSAGWHPDLDEIVDTTRNVTSRTPKREPPYSGGGPAPSENEIK